MQSHLIPTSIRSSTSVILPDELEPGFGSTDMHLGLSEGELLDRLNEPDRKEQMDGSVYFIYRKANLEVEFRNGRVERLFFFRPVNSRKVVKVDRREVAYGMSRMQILQRFGKPGAQGKGRTILDKYVRSWIYYPSGVQFEFGRSGRLELITIAPIEKA